MAYVSVWSKLMMEFAECFFPAIGIDKWWWDGESSPMWSGVSIRTLHWNLVFPCATLGVGTTVGGSSREEEFAQRGSAETSKECAAIAAHPVWLKHSKWPLLRPGFEKSCAFNVLLLHNTSCDVNAAHLTREDCRRAGYSSSRMTFKEGLWYN